MGLLSLMDAILEVPIGVVVEQLPLDPVTKAQLLGAKTDNKTALSPIYERSLMVARNPGLAKSYQTGEGTQPVSGFIAALI